MQFRNSGSTLLWSRHSILRSSETRLPECSGNLGGVQRRRSSVAWGFLGQLTATVDLIESDSSFHRAKLAQGGQGIYSGQQKMRPVIFPTLPEGL
jgi:hypothetical protein